MILSWSLFIAPLRPRRVVFDVFQSSATFLIITNETITSQYNVAVTLLQRADVIVMIGREALYISRQHALAVHFWIPS